MTIMGLAVLLFLVLTVFGIVRWADNDARMKAAERWPDNWHELIK